MLDTSGLTTMLIRPSCRMVGVKASEMPNCLNSTVMVGRLPPFALDCAIGIGNSPPARKLAVSPDIATRLGSARVLTRPLVSSASNRKVRSPPPTLQARDAVPKVFSGVLRGIDQGVAGR